MTILKFVIKQCIMLLLCSFITTTANAKICFLPDGNCGTGSIHTQCDGVRFFTDDNLCNRARHPASQKCEDAGACKELKCIYSGQGDCEAEADRLSYKYRHYFCKLDEDVGCWYLDYTTCSESTDEVGCDNYTLSAPKEGEACDSCTKRVTKNLCSNKGLPYTEDSTKTAYACNAIKSETRGCDGYNLSSPTSGYACSECTPDIYKTDFNGNWNKTGTGNKVYKCDDKCSSDGYTLDAKQDENCYSCSACQYNSTKYKCTQSLKTGYRVENGACVYKCSGYDLSAAKDENCYSCSACPDDSSKYKCEEKVKDGYQLTDGVCSIKETCPSGYSTDYQSQNDCKSGETFSSNGTANGLTCGACSTKACPSGFTTSTSCDTNNGYTLFEHPNYPGCYKCQCQNQGVINGKCTNCQAEGYTKTQTTGYTCTDACPLTSTLFKTCKQTECTETCPSGYSFDKTSVSSCGVQGPGGWTFDSKTVCGKTCGKCTAKTCPSGYSTAKKTCAYPTTQVSSGYSGNDACTKCASSSTSSCPSGAYATQAECQKNVPTNTCDGATYGGACKKGSKSGCWKPFSTMQSRAVLSCSGNTCNLGFCLSEGLSTSGYFGSACVKVPNSSAGSQWKSENTGFNYSDAGIVSCSVTTSRKTGEGCASSPHASASSTCRAEMIIGKSPYEKDNGNW